MIADVYELKHNSLSPPIVILLVSFYQDKFSALLHVRPRSQNWTTGSVQHVCTARCPTNSFKALQAKSRNKIWQTKLRSKTYTSCPAGVVWWLDTCVPCAVERDVHCVPLVRGSIRATARVRRVRLRKSSYVKIIPMHMMIREIIPGRQQRVRWCPL